MSDRLRWDPELTRAGAGRSILRDPIRLALAVGSVIMAIGALAPWAQGMIGLLPVSFGGLDGAADGLIMFTLAIALALIARNPGFLEAADEGRRWAPMLIGLACVCLWLLGRQAAEMEIGRWENDDGSGSLQPGYWVAGVGVAIVAIAGSIASLRHHEGESGGRLSLVRKPRRSDLVPLATTLGAIVGMVAGAAFALALFPPVTVGAPMVFFGGIGVVLGAFGGRRIGRALARLLG
jgi:hypothetical protein